MIILSTQTVIQAPAERCFDLARSVDLHAASACVIQGKAVAGRTVGLAALGDRTTWSARFFGLRFSLTTEITAFNRPGGFSDVLCAGLFRHFGHIYTFQSAGPMQTVMTDEFSFQSPFGFVGAALDMAILRHRMRAVLDFRARYVKRVAESEEWREYFQENIP